MLSVLGFSLQFAQVLSPPTEVIEEFELLPLGPLREVVTARATYAPGRALALLPGSVQGTEIPGVQAFGHGALLHVARSARGWVASLPERRGPVRLVARVIRPTRTPRLFALRWPVLGDYPARRVITLPRDYIRQEAPGWTCPQGLEPTRLSCVSTRNHPTGFSLSLPAPPSSVSAGVLAMVVNGLVWAGIARAPSRGPVTLYAAALGALVSASFSLTLVGALSASWSTSCLFALPLGTVLGSLAPRSLAGRWAGAFGAMLIPVLSATYGALGAVMCAACACALVVSLGAMSARNSVEHRGFTP